MNKQNKEEYSSVISTYIKSLSDEIWNYEALVAEPLEYKDDTVRDAVHVLAHVLLAKSWAIYKKDNVEPSSRELDARAMGNALRELVLEYTNVDTYEGNK